MTDHQKVDIQRIGVDNAARRANVEKTRAQRGLVDL